MGLLQSPALPLGYPASRSTTPKHISPATRRKPPPDHKTGASGRTRTCNLLIRSQKLYPIELRMRCMAGSTPEPEKEMGWSTGFEPATTRSTIWGSNQAELRPPLNRPPHYDAPFPRSRARAHPGPTSAPCLAGWPRGCPRSSPNCPSPLSLSLGTGAFRLPAAPPASPRNRKPHRLPPRKAALPSGSNLAQPNLDPPAPCTPRYGTGTALTVSVSTSITQRWPGGAPGTLSSRWAANSAKLTGNRPACLTKIRSCSVRNGST